VGTIVERRTVAQRGWFTPTGVGTMIVTFGVHHHLSVHPHGRGDNDCPGLFQERVGGSPPRAWGQFSLFPDCVENLRFTPTGVGTIYGSFRMSSP